MEQKELVLQVILKASNTVPDSGEMLHEGELSLGASCGSSFSCESASPGLRDLSLILYEEKPGSVFPANK